MHFGLHLYVIHDLAKGKGDECVWQTMTARFASIDVNTTRCMPTNVEAEAALLGAVLLNNAAWHAIGPNLHTEHFWEEIHRRIWDVASTLIREGRVASPLTLKTYLGDHDLGAGMTVPHYLARLAADATTIVNAPDYARMVTELHARRALIAVAAELDAQAHDPPPDTLVERLIERAEGALMEVRTRALAQTAITRIDAVAAADELLAKVDRIRAGEAVPLGVTTGIPGIDQDTKGMRPGDLWVVAGRTSMGKTIMAIALARAAARSGAGTILFPFEIGKEQAAARILSDLAYSPRAPLGYGCILAGEVNEEDRWRLDDARARLAEMPLVFDAADGATLATISARVRSEREKMTKQGVKLGVVILDYLNFIGAGDRYRGNRPAEIGEISIGLKRLATSLGICVVLLAQVNRLTEQRDDKRPGIADLKDSGSLEQDADVVVLMYRDSYYIERSPAYLKGEPEAVVRANDARNEIEVIVAKNRIGGTRSHKLWCDVPCSIIADQARGGL